MGVRVAFLTRKAPLVWATSVTLVMVITAVWLGVWQWQRWHWKDSLLTTLSQSDPNQFKSLDSYLDLIPKEFSPVKMRGSFRHDLALKVTPRTLHGKVGAHLFTPFILSNGTTVLINRGWIPDTKAREISYPHGEIQVLGFVRYSDKPHWFTPENNPDSGLWHSVNLEQMQTFFARRDKKIANNLMPFYIMARPGSSESPQPLDLVRNLSNNHFQYMVTWFGLALVIILVYTSYTFSRHWE